MILLSLHAFIYISNSHSHSHFYIRGHLLLLLLLLSPHNPFTFKSFFTFLPFYSFTFKTASRRSACYVPTQSFVRRHVAVATSGRSFRCIGRRDKRHRNIGWNPERCTFRFVKYLSVVFGIVNFLPVCASTV